MFNKFPFDIKEKQLRRWLKENKNIDLDEQDNLHDIVNKVIRSCKDCSRRLNNGVSGPVPPKLYKDSQVLIIVRSPNLDDDELGNLFVPTTTLGALYDKMLYELGIKYTINSVTSVCHCPNKRNRRTELLDENDIVACQKWKSLEELVTGKVPVVILMGDDPCRMVLSNRFANVKGKYFYIGDTLVIPVPHPGSFRLEPNFKVLFDKTSGIYKELIQKKLSE